MSLPCRQYDRRRWDRTCMAISSRPQNAHWKESEGFWVSWLVRALFPLSAHSLANQILGWIVTMSYLYLLPTRCYSIYETRHRCGNMWLIEEESIKRLGRCFLRFLTTWFSPVMSCTSLLWRVRIYETVFDFSALTYRRSLLELECIWVAAINIVARLPRAYG